MGRPKALLPVGRSGESFIGRIIRILRRAGQDDVIVVLGHEAEAIAASVRRSASPPPRIVVNARFSEGQLSSLHTALEVVDRPGVDGMLVTLVDVPLFSESTVRAVVEAYQRTKAPIVRPVQDGRHGHPVVFDRAVFDELRRADPAMGAKAVVRAHASEIVEVQVDDAGSFADIDTPEDYQRLIGPLPQG